MPVWNPNSVNDEPVTTMKAWKVVEVSRKGKNRTRHVVGNCGEGRVSSTIVDFDPANRVATTKSGRKYELPIEGSKIYIGPDAVYVFNVWFAYNDATDKEDVTHDYV